MRILVPGGFHVMEIESELYHIGEMVEWISQYTKKTMMTNTSMHVCMSVDKIGQAKCS